MGWGLAGGGRGWGLGWGLAPSELGVAQNARTHLTRVEIDGEVAVSDARRAKSDVGEQHLQTNRLGSAAQRPAALSRVMLPSQWQLGAGTGEKEAGGSMSAGIAARQWAGRGASREQGRASSNKTLKNNNACCIP